MKRHTRILIVDDHAVVREGIKHLLASIVPPQDIIEAANGHEALQALETGTADIAIVDLEIPDCNGFELIDSIAGSLNAPRILVYTMHEEPWIIAELQQTQVSGIVLKGDNPHELITAVESAKAGLPYYSMRFTALADKTRPLLTARETEILSLLGDGYSSRQVAELLFISENTIEYHRKQILRRLGARNNMHAISIALKSGLLVDI